MLKKYALLFCLIILLFGCTEKMREDFGNMGALRKAVQKEFNEEDIRVTIQNGVCVGVSFVNTKYNDEPEDVQEEVRQKTLKLINEYFPDEKEINRAWVAFVIYKKYFFVFTYSNALNTTFYDRDSNGNWVNTRNDIERNKAKET